MAFSSTRYQLIRRLAMLYLNDWREGTITSTSSSFPNRTFVDVTRNEDDDFFNETSPVSWFRVMGTTDGLAPVGEEMDITSWVLYNSTGGLRANLTAPINTGDTYAIGHTFRWFQMVEAINEAIDIAAQKIKVTKTDETLTTATNVFDYAIPAGFTHLFRISIEDAPSAGTYRNIVPNGQWEVVRSATNTYLRLNRFSPIDYPEGHIYGGTMADFGVQAGCRLRLEGLARQDVLTLDNSICTIDPNFVCAYAAYRLFTKHGARQDLDPSNKSAKGNIYYAEAMRLLTTMSTTTLPMNCKRVEL